jgi:hypothetical protein
MNIHISNWGGNPIGLQAYRCAYTKAKIALPLSGRKSDGEAPTERSQRLLSTTRNRIDVLAFILLGPYKAY